MATREQWIEACGSTSVAVNTEDYILSCGRECLPGCAIAVLDGAQPTADYWAFLLEQLAQIDLLDTVGVDAELR
jgi:hypothetical protein